MSITKFNIFKTYKVGIGCDHKRIIYLNIVERSLLFKHLNEMETILKIDKNIELEAMTFKMKRLMNINSQS